MRYFAYGSNLNLEDLNRYALEHGFEKDHFRFFRKAWLPDHTTRFHYYSPGRKGGALDVVPQLGTAVPGVILDVNERGWSLLDHKEGAGQRYARVPKHVLDFNGEQHRVQTYIVTDAHRRPQFIPPTPAYTALTREGLLHFELPTGLLDASSRDHLLSGFPDKLFVYGTLMRLECRHDFVKAQITAPVQKSTIAGQLWDLGAYPGWAHGEGRIHGELLTLSDLTQVLPRLDEEEDFGGYANDKSLYRRVLVQTHIETKTLWAWTYLYVGDLGGATLIASGNWRQHTHQIAISPLRNS